MALVLRPISACRWTRASASCFRRRNATIHDFSAMVPQNVEATLNGVPFGLDLPRRFKGSDFDQEICRSTCNALANSIAQGNHHHVDGLITALRLMMPAQSGSERAFARPRDDFILRPEVLLWSKQDFLGGLEAGKRTWMGMGWLSDCGTCSRLNLTKCISVHLQVKFMQDLATLRCKQNRQAEAATLLEAPQDDVTIAKLRDSVGMCYDGMGRYEDAIFHLAEARLEEIPLESENLARLAKLQEMDRDGNAGVLYERMSRALVLCSPAKGDPAERKAASHRRAMARALLTQAAPLVADATAQGLADLSHAARQEMWRTSGWMSIQ
eukprot:Skav219299  [mRNA]  locus=scaffold2157:495765:503343:- [translate_table: standard]